MVIEFKVHKHQGLEPDATVSVNKELCNSKSKKKYNFLHHTFIW